MGWEDCFQTFVQILSVNWRKKDNEANLCVLYGDVIFAIGIAYKVLSFYFKFIFVLWWIDGKKRIMEYKLFFKKILEIINCICGHMQIWIAFLRGKKKRKKKKKKIFSQRKYSK